MGSIVKNGIIRDHIEVDPAVTSSIVSWLNNNLVPPPPANIPAADNIPNEGEEIPPQEQKAVVPILPPEQIPATDQ
jgi:hypothetical protein